MSQALETTTRDQPRFRAAGEPAPFEIVNPKGSAPVVLVCDHASNFVPRALDNLGLSEAELDRHIGWDIGIAEVTRGLAERLDAPAVLSHFSRLIVDPNRTPGTANSIPEISDGVEIPGNRNLTEAERKARLDEFFLPYHNAVAEQIEAKMARGPGPAFVSMHSFTPVMNGVERRIKVGVLWNTDPRMPVPFMKALESRGIPYGDNEPYSGRDFHGYTIHQQAEPRGLPNLLIELRQDLIDTQKGAAEWVTFIGDLVAPILADKATYESSGGAG